MKFRQNKFICPKLCVLGVLCVSVVNCFALDRQAFTFTNYDLSVQIEPEQHRMGVRGKITLRNDTQVSQKIAVLQISSSLDWRSIKADGKAVQFLTQPLTSDIDHTGELSEAVITLPDAVAPKGTVELEIGYEGVILIDVTRLTRIGTPEDVAKNTDWDQIDSDFTAVRGAGYVAWYPIATEVVNLSESSSLFDVLGRWTAREASATMRLHFGLIPDSSDPPLELLVNDPACAVVQTSSAKHQGADCNFQPLGLAAPAFVIANYSVLEHPDIDTYFLRGHDASAAACANAAQQALPLITDWFGKPREKARTADLPDPQAAPFESGALLMTPLAKTDTKLDGLAAVHQLTHAALFSPRPWIEEGLAHFTQALYLEQTKGRQAALDYMALHRSALNAVEPATTAPRSEDEQSRSLVNTTNEELFRSKAMCVWWMLRDMVGDTALKNAIAAYRPEEDKDPSYMPRLIAFRAQRDLAWFFDDWVYHDRGLPDFKVESAFSRETPTKSFLVTVTVQNLGAAGAEVPVSVKFKSGEVVKRLEVKAKSKSTVRVEVPTEPQEIVVNDGSVPESDVTNNVFKIESAVK